jgi:hypothetical protein
MAHIKGFKKLILRSPLIAAATVIVTNTASVAKADESTPPDSKSGPYTPLRYDEDYSYLADPSARTDYLDPVKYIAIGNDKDFYLTLGGQLRDRYEYFDNYTFGSGTQDHNGYNLVRVLLNVDLHLSQYIRVFVQGISATEQDRDGGPRATDENEADLQQGFVDIKVPLGDDASLTLRGGRQVIVFGKERLIGVSDWTNVRRTDDGARATLVTPGNTLDVFYAQPVNVLPYQFDNDVPDTYFAGIYDTLDVPGEWAKQSEVKLEMYGLYVNRLTNKFNTTLSGEDRYTFGTRVSGVPKPFDFDLETDYQLGRFDEQATHSFSVAAIGGYTMTNSMLAPRVFLGGDIASGGTAKHPGDAFDQLFPSGHDQFGIIDAIGRQNIIDVHPGVTFDLLENKPGAKKLTLLTQYRQFWRESDQDAVYTAAGTILRPSGGSNASGVGGEVDVQLDWQLDRHISGYVGYCHFFHGAFISQTGPDEDIDFAYASLSFTF